MYFYFLFFRVAVADYGLTDTLLEDPESADFLNKFVGGAHNAYPLIDTDFRFTTFHGGSPAEEVGAIPPPPEQSPAQRKPSPAQRSSQQRGQHPTPLSPLGGSRLGKRKSTPTKKVATKRGVDGGNRTRERRSPVAGKEAKGNEGDKQAMADEIAEYLKKPHAFEDLINECVG